MVTENQDSSQKPPAISGRGSRKARLSAARIAAVQAVYQMDANDQQAKAVVEEFMSFRLGKNVDGQEMILPDGVLFRDIVMGVSLRRADLEGIISSSLKKQSRYSKIAEEGGVAVAEPLLQAIFLCGAFEIMTHHDIEAAIIISDYLNVTHAFYDQGEDRLVNGVLDAISKILR